MLNRTPPNKPNTSNVLSSYRKRRQLFKGPFLIYSAAALLLILGIALVVSATRSGNNPIGALFPTDTFTPTLTFTPTNTVTPSLTPTITLTPTETLTPTPSGPTTYIVLGGDTIQGIAEKYNLGDDGVLLILDANPSIQNAQIFAGDTLVIPPPGTIPFTRTPIPSGVREIKYTVLPGDTLLGIVAKFNTTQENIIALNASLAENPNILDPGQVLTIRVNLVTATATLPPSSTPVTPTIEGQPTQAGPTATAPAASFCAPTENLTFVTDLQKLINDARASAGLNVLNVNDKLALAAKLHAVDMLCNNYFGHLGPDGSTPESRVVAQGYTASSVSENLYALHPAYGGNPQSAFDWWMKSDAASRSNLLSANVTEFGVAYVVSDNSLFGGYFVVLFAKP